MTNDPTRIFLRRFLLRQTFPLLLYCFLLPSTHRHLLSLFLVHIPSMVRYCYSEKKDAMAVIEPVVYMAVLAALLTFVWQAISCDLVYIADTYKVQMSTSSSFGWTVLYHEATNDNAPKQQWMNEHRPDCQHLAHRTIEVLQAVLVHTPLLPTTLLLTIWIVVMIVAALRGVIQVYFFEAYDDDDDTTVGFALPHDGLRYDQPRSAVEQRRFHSCIRTSLQDLVVDTTTAHDHQQQYDDCQICWERLLPPGDCCCTLVQAKTCRHVFHRDCMHAWLALSPKCPLCKGDYLTPRATLAVQTAGGFEVHRYQ